MNGFFITFDKSPVHVWGGGFTAASFGKERGNLRGAFDVTIFLVRKDAHDAIKMLCEKKTPQWKKRFDVDTLVAGRLRGERVR